MTDQINAEYLLTQLYPELDETWIARHKGTFFRNYSSDMMKIYPDEKLTELSRDGVLKLLPPSFLSDEDELKGANRAAEQKKVKQRLHLLDEAFVPVDTIRFHQKVQMERTTQPILEMMMQYILKEYFNYDISAETNRYIMEAATLLPFINILRGDIHLVRSLIGIITGYDVDMSIRDYSAEDTTVYSVPNVRYCIHADNLSSEDYLTLLSDIRPFMDFLNERFLPFDIKATIAITGNNESRILEYNSTIR